MAPTTPQPSAVSSRLLSMKFMQRAVADTPPSSAESSSKRRKLAHGSSPAAAPIDDPFSQARVRAAMEETEAKRAAAVERRAAEMQEARWVLDAPAVGAAAGGRRPLDVVYVGYGEIDRAARGEEDDDGEDNGGEDRIQSGRRVTGNYKRKEEKEEAKSADDSTDSESDSASDTPRRKRKGDGGEKRRKDVKLSRLVSISGGGGGQAGGGPAKQGMKCFGCGGSGHKASSSECPKNRGGRKRRSEG